MRDKKTETTKTETKPIVSIAMGSDSDIPIMQEAGKILADFNVAYELFLTSAHRSPQRTETYAKGLKKRGVKIVIVGAGMAAHLAGVIAANCELPVIGVPLDASSLNGMDA
ncbi:MAG: AIR carboxylase family protein, partial [Deltaproteobacteria bacterium]